MPDDHRVEVTLSEAADAFSVGREAVTFFSGTDLFNESRPLEGAVCCVEDHRYGALYLRQISGKRQPQIIHATPRIGYPFTFAPDGTRIYHFPEVTKVEFYEKLDGTNIFAYRYCDDGQTCVGYKTRRQPLLDGRECQQWVRLWQRILEKYPEIPMLPVHNRAGISFELFGSMNPHLVAYDVLLDARVLFGINDKAEVIPVSALDLRGVPAARLEAEVTSQTELEATYEQLRVNVARLNKLHAGTLAAEGLVLYCHTRQHEVVPFKCKPEDIEEVHWAGGRIHKTIIRQAALKVLENGQELDVQNVCRLLLEDWAVPQVEAAAAIGSLDEVIAAVHQEQAFKAEVLQRYNALGIRLQSDKNAVMRALSTHFGKSAMQRVYGIIAFDEGLL